MDESSTMKEQRVAGFLIRTASNSWDRIWHAKSHCGMYDNSRACVFSCGLCVFLHENLQGFFFHTKDNREGSAKFTKTYHSSVWVFKDITNVRHPHLPPLFSLWPIYTITLSDRCVHTLTLACVHTQNLIQESLFTQQVLYVQTDI